MPVQVVLDPCVAALLRAATGQEGTSGKAGALFGLLTEDGSRVLVCRAVAGGDGNTAPPELVLPYGLHRLGRFAVAEDAMVLSTDAEGRPESVMWDGALAEVVVESTGPLLARSHRVLLVSAHLSLRAPLVAEDAISPDECIARLKHRLGREEAALVLESGHLVDAAGPDRPFSELADTGAAFTSPFGDICPCSLAVETVARDEAEAPGQGRDASSRLPFSAALDVETRRDEQRALPPSIVVPSPSHSSCPATTPVAVSLCALALVSRKASSQETRAQAVDALADQLPACAAAWRRVGGSVSRTPTAVPHQPEARAVGTRPFTPGLVDGWSTQADVQAACVSLLPVCLVHPLMAETPPPPSPPPPVEAPSPLLGLAGLLDVGGGRPEELRAADPLTALRSEAHAALLLPHLPLLRTAQCMVADAALMEPGTAAGGVCGKAMALRRGGGRGSGAEAGGTEDNAWIAEALGGGGGGGGGGKRKAGKKSKKKGGKSRPAAPQQGKQAAKQAAPALTTLPSTLAQCWSQLVERNGGWAPLLSVHEGVPGSDIAGASEALARGPYAYYHYTQGREDDRGWGCAYRSLQTLCSWALLNALGSGRVPSIADIQRVLVAMGDKTPSFVGSRHWIGSQEVGYVLDELFGIQCRYIVLPSGSEIKSRARELARHFDTEGTPVMIGGGALAYTLLGVAFHEGTGEARFLILDPHYTGPDELDTIQGKTVAMEGYRARAVSWRGMDAFSASSFYNLCLPQRPRVV